MRTVVACLWIGFVALTPWTAAAKGGEERGAPSAAATPTAKGAYYRYARVRVDSGKRQAAIRFWIECQRPKSAAGKTKKKGVRKR